MARKVVKVNETSFIYIDLQFFQRYDAIGKNNYASLYFIPVIKLIARMFYYRIYKHTRNYSYFSETIIKPEAL
jgi:hypothetical protein